MRYYRVLPLVALLLITACGGLATPTPRPIGVDKVERIAVYSMGGEEVINPGDRKFTELAKQLLATLPSLNLPAGCVFSEDEVSAMRGKERLVELLFKAPERVTIGELIPKEERERILTDEKGFRVLEVQTAFLVLSGEYRGHVFLPSDGVSPTWGCWAIEKEKEIDTRWVEAVEKALEE
jgi:hypothetical protein